jgi:hypothetical protein
VVRLTFLFLFLASSAFAQSNFAIVSGTVTDPQHLPVASATVSFRASKTGELRLVTTNEHGLFEVAALLPGDYEVKTEAAGFATAEQTLRLEVGQRLTIEISLQVGAVRQTAEVQGGMEVLRTADASVGEVVEPKSVRELPLNGRMLIDLVLTVPGACWVRRTDWSNESTLLAARTTLRSCAWRWAFERKLLSARWGYKH